MGALSIRIVVPLQEARQFFNTASKQLESKEHVTKGSVFQQIQHVMQMLGLQHPEVLTLGSQDSVGEMTRLVAQLAEHRSTAKGWSRDNFAQKFAEAMKIYESTVTVAKKLHADLTALKTVRLLEVRAFSGDRRKVALAVRRVLKPLPLQSFWRSMLTWLGEHPLGISVAKQEITPMSSKHIASGACGA